MLFLPQCPITRTDFQAVFAGEWWGRSVTPLLRGNSSSAMCLHLLRGQRGFGDLLRAE